MTKTNNAAKTHIRLVNRSSHAIKIPQGVAIRGVTLVTQQRAAAHPGRSRTSLPTVNRTSVATPFAPKAKATVQLSKSTSVEWPNVIIMRR